jgi:MarR family transcriptional regulator, 2-MHQ and catechol-resistance regulon repressor
MATATLPRHGGDEDRPVDAADSLAGPEDGTGSCGVLGQMDDDRIRLMGLIVRSHRRLTDCLGRELEQAVGIPLVFFDVLINVGAAPDGWLTMSRLSSDVALTTGGVTRLVDRMVDAGLVERQHCPNDRRSVRVVLTVEGRSTLERAIAAHLEGIDRHLMAPLDATDRAALAVALRKVLDAGC